MVPSKYQQDILDRYLNGTDNIIVKARAGSGKTSMLQLLCEHSDPLLRILNVAFNKSISVELARRLPTFIDCATHHSVAFRAYGKTRRVRVKVDGQKVGGIYDRLFPPRNGGSHWDRAEDDKDGLRGGVVKLVALAKAGALVPESGIGDWEDIVDRHDLEFGENDGGMAAGIDRAREVLRVNNQTLDVIDFDDMLYLCWLVNAPLQRYDVVMIDEAQDTNAVQRALLQRMLDGGGRLIAVGDEYQAIYGFRGADGSAMALMQEQFAMVDMPLSISYRCPSSVIDAANDALGIGGVIEARDNAPEGRVETLDKWCVADFVPTDLIVCRNTAPVIALAYKLVQARMPVKVLGRDIGRGLISIVKKLGGTDIDDLETRLDGWENREVSKALAARKEMLAQRIEDQAASLRACIEGLPEDGRTIAGLIAGIDRLFDDDANGGRTTLATVHKAKGLEATRVFVLDRGLMPSRYARQGWQIEQERNLVYVAYTRSLDTLYLLDSARVQG